MLYYSIISAIIYGITGMIDTVLVKNNNIHVVFVIKQFIHLLAGIIIFLFFFKQHFLSIDIKLKDKIFIFITSFLGTIATFLFLFTLSKTNNKQITFCIVYALPIVIYTILNYLIYNKDLNNIQIFGTILICIGLILIEKYNNI
uniref:EamA domain-containing protein n=1 Tax=Florenciella sp. virus SA2 TaxID=3240092 RepID=A0AB39JEM1_9VIRU